MSETESVIEGWGILELMGHRRLGGRLSKATIAGAAFVRIDVPHPNDSSQVSATQFYSPSAVYAITPTTEEIACAIAIRAPQPVTRWELPALPQRHSATTDQEEAVTEILDELDDRPF